MWPVWYHCLLRWRHHSCHPHMRETSWTTALHVTSSQPMRITLSFWRIMIWIKSFKGTQKEMPHHHFILLIIIISISYLKHVISIKNMIQLVMITWNFGVNKMFMIHEIKFWCGIPTWSCYSDEYWYCGLQVSWFSHR